MEKKLFFGLDGVFGIADLKKKETETEVETYV
jgi:hypothetical protein